VHAEGPGERCEVHTGVLEASPDEPALQRSATGARDPARVR
jgi:hypothetical protein